MRRDPNHAQHATSAGALFSTEGVFEIRNHELFSARNGRAANEQSDLVTFGRSAAQYRGDTDNPQATFSERTAFDESHDAHAVQKPLFRIGCKASALPISAKSPSAW